MCALSPGGAELLDRMAGMGGLRPGMELLDVGCGDGGSLDRLVREHGVVGVGLEPEAGLLRAGRERYPHLALVEGGMDRMPFAPQSFDAVLMQCVLSLSDNPECALREAHRVLRPGGVLLLCDLYMRRPGPVRARAAGQASGRGAHGAFGLRELFALCGAAGFVARAWEDHSAALGSFVAQAILQCGSLEVYWAQALPEGVPLEMVAPCGARKGAGYCALVAEKPV